MAVSRALRRLLRIRDLEEEQCRLALESALGDLHRLRHALTTTLERERRGRKLLAASAHTGQLADRLAGAEEIRSAGRHATALSERIAAAEGRAGELRQAFLAKQIERRQAETLIRETEARDAIEASRRSQQALDNWYGIRRHREEAAKASPPRASTGSQDWSPDDPDLRALEEKSAEAKT